MKINTYTVVPSLPDKLKCLSELAYNLHWCWDPETLGLFQRLDRDLWNETYHNSDPDARPDIPGTTG